ncbi:MAG: sigma 54-interacting transcriptional regulator [Myxococcaceae bacterium]
MTEPRTRSLGGKLAELPARLRLVARHGAEVLATHDFTRGAVTVGSAADNALVLRNATVSRHHAELVTRGGAVLVKDLDSRNGTRFQGSRIKEAFVPVGAVLLLGEVELRLEDGDESAVSHLGRLVSRNPAMRAALESLAKAARTDATVLLEAETGTGKDVTARAVHAESRRSAGPFETLDCGALPKDLAASELFGHVKGAFTGAERSRPGAFERAHGGTLFLDEVGELPLELQPLLLRALERREVRRVGDEQARPVDVRVIAATHRDLDAEVKAGRFRADLLHRLAVVRVRLPPLRERVDDLPTLARAVLDDLGPRAQGFTLSPALLDSLAAHRWPGNVRELKNLIERAVTLGELPPLPAGTKATKSVDYQRARDEALGAFERDFVVHVLRTFDGNVSKAAREAKVDRVYLHKLIKRHRIDPKSL